MPCYAYTASRPIANSKKRKIIRNIITSETIETAEKDLRKKYSDIKIEKIERMSYDMKILSNKYRV